MDNSDKKQTEQRLLQSENTYQSLLNHINSGMVVHAPDTSIVYANPAACKLLGLTENQLRGVEAMDPLWQFLREDSTEMPLDEYPVNQVLKGAELHYLFLAVNRASKGDRVWLLVDGYSVPDESGQIEQIIITFVDITKRKKAEEELRKSEETYRGLLDNLNSGVVVHGRDTVIVYANSRAASILGLTLEQMMGTKSMDPQWYFLREDSSRMPLKEYPVNQILFTKRPLVNWVVGVNRPQYKDYSWVLVNGFCIFDNAGEVDRVIINFLDITERKRSEEALADEKEQLMVTLQSIGDGVITTDILGDVVMMNRVAEQLTGWSISKAKGWPLSEIFNIFNEQSSEPSKNPVEQVLKSGEIEELANHTRLLRPDHSSINIADSAAPIKDKRNKVIGAVLVFRDMTDKLKMQQALQMSSKLQSLGTLAGGIAHDFNNLLGGIMGFIDLAERVSEKEEVSAYLNQSLQSIERARGLTQQLLTFSKGGIPVKTLQDLSSFIHETVKFALSGSSCTADFHIAKDLWIGEFDKNQMGQVIDNIVINAIEASPRGGVIIIVAKNKKISLKDQGVLKAGKYIEISIIDEGIGMDPHLINCIFDPFYTTKDRGNGLGLTTCFSIMEHHGGPIEVESQPKMGSTFHLYIPAISESEKKETSQKELLLQGVGTILVMDDEKVIRDVLTHMLEALGYSVVTAKDGAEAIGLYRKFKDRGLVAMIFDLTIPGGMSGKDAIAQIRNNDKEIPVFVASGYAEDPILANPGNYGFTSSINKPFLIKDLAELLNKYIK
ncbi:MAG: PAS domain S-box protein [Spirochaetaceae bacterium]|nr:PAS domain S-box protein [Spirochaetaceae bacterium]